MTDRVHPGVRWLNATPRPGSNALALDALCDRATRIAVRAVLGHELPRRGTSVDGPAVTGPASDALVGRLPRPPGSGSAGDEPARAGTAID